MASSVADALEGVDEHQSVGGEQLHCTSLVLYLYSNKIIIITIIISLLLLNCLYLNTSSIFFQFFLWDERMAA